MNTCVVEYDPDMDEDEIDAEVAEILWLINERILDGSCKKVMAVALSFAMKEIPREQRSIRHPSLAR